ncbi:hypothetical protein SAMN04487786_0489 [Paenisporosarcina quisquiliarum]|nr:hypothetical protein SAMN04487786_0489 [Paenisporosarcina quisquiliarum]
MWVVANGKELQEFNKLYIFVIFMILQLFVSVLGSYRIWTWIKEEEM